MTDESSLRRAGRAMAVATLASRVAGLVRVLVAALGLGTPLLDSYTVANTLPNSVYEVVVGGAMASVVVPLLTRAALTEADAGVAYAQRLLSLLAYGLGAVTLLAMAAAPWLVDLCATGFTAEKRELAVVLSRFFLPQLLFYGMSAVAGAVLNSRGRFAAPMWAPLLNSLVVIAVGGAYLVVGGATSVPAMTTADLLLLGLGTSAGVVAQAALVMWALTRSGFPLRPRKPRGVGIRRIVRLGGWVVVSVAAAQVLFLAATRSASAAGEGGLGILQTAYPVFLTPYAVVALSVMTALLPRLSRSAARRDRPRLVADLSLGLRLSTVVVAPVAVAMVVLGPQLAVLLFAHGRSAAGSVGLLGAVVAAFGLALVPFTGYMIMLRGFYAEQDTRTPALLTIAVSAVGVAGCLAAMALLPAQRAVVGIPLAYAAAYTVGLLGAAVVLRHRWGRIDGRRLLAMHARVAVAAAVAAAAAATGVRLLTPLAGPGWTGSLLTVTVCALAGALAYAAAARVVRLAELRELIATAAGAIRLA